MDLTQIRFDIDGTARCRSCDTKLVYATDAKAGEPVKLTCLVPQCRGNVARRAPPYQIPLAMSCFGARLSEHVENRYEVLVDVALAVRLPGVSSEIMAQIDASPRLEMALRKVCDAHESLLKSVDDTGFLEASMSASGIPAARAILAKLEESRKR